MEAGVDPNLKDQYGRTALQLTSRKGCLEVVKLLIKRGANVKVQDKYSETALHWASSRGHLEVMKLLLKNGADVSIGKIKGLFF